MSANKLDKISRDIGTVKEDISAIKADVATHIKRTNQNESRIDILQSQHDQIVGAANFIKLTGIVAGIAEAISLILRHI